MSLLEYPAVLARITVRSPKRVLSSVVSLDWRGPVNATAENSRAARHKIGFKSR